MLKNRAVQSVRTVAVVLLVVGLAGCRYPLHWDGASTGGATSAVGQGDCSPAAPAGASEAAVAYLAAVDAATPAWQAVDATLRSEGYVTHRDDLLSQVDADAPFLTALRAIDFPPAAAPAAQDLIAAVQAYDDFLTTAYDNEGYMAGHMNTDATLNDARAASSARLRDALGLPASSCVYNRP